MHILHALFTQYKGGLEQAYVNITAALTSKGHKVTALMRSDAPYLEEIRQQAADVEMLNPLGFYDIFSIWKIHRLIKQIKPDLIVAHNGRAIRLFSVAAAGTGTKVCGAVHSYKTKHALHADILIVLCEHMRRHFEAAGFSSDRMWVMPNMIRLTQKPSLRTRGMPVVIGAIGRFVEEKGFDLLLEALHQVKKSGIDFKLKLAGDGPLKASLQQLAEKLGLSLLIDWEGWISDKKTFYAGLDMLCIPSRTDYFPIVVLETLAHGIPIISTATYGPAEVLTSGVNGLIVPCGDVTALASAIKKLVEQPEFSAQISEEGWRRVQEYDFPAIAERWDRLLREVSTVKK